MQTFSPKDRDPPLVGDIPQRKLDFEFRLSHWVRIGRICSRPHAGAQLEFAQIWRR
jgi:hypothetical protein